MTPRRPIVKRGARAQHVVDASPSAGVAAEAPAGEAETAASTAPRAPDDRDRWHFWVFDVWTHEVGVGEGEVR